MYTFFFKYNFHFFSPENISLVLKDLAPFTGFGGVCGAAPTGLNQGEDVPSSGLHESNS